MGYDLAVHLLTDPRRECDIQCQHLYGTSITTTDETQVTCTVCRLAITTAWGLTDGSQYARPQLAAAMDVYHRMVQVNTFASRFFANSAVDDPRRYPTYMGVDLGRGKDRTSTVYLHPVLDSEGRVTGHRVLQHLEAQAKDNGVYSISCNGEKERFVLDAAEFRRRCRAAGLDPLVVARIHGTPDEPIYPGPMDTALTVADFNRARTMLPTPAASTTWLRK